MLYLKLLHSPRSEVYTDYNKQSVLCNILYVIIRCLMKRRIVQNDWYVVNG